MKDKTDSQLKIIAKDRAFQSVEKRLEALCELETRDALDSELLTMKSDLERSLLNGKNDKSYMETDDGYKNEGIVPMLYSKSAIYRFSFLFTAITGSVLLMINLFRLKKVWQGILMMILNSIVAFIVTFFFDFGLLRIMIVNGVIGYLSLNYWWNRYIGKDIKFDKKPIIIPLIISIILSAIIIWLIYSENYFVWQDLI